VKVPDAAAASRNSRDALFWRRRDRSRRALVVKKGKVGSPKRRGYELKSPVERYPHSRTAGTFQAQEGVVVSALEPALEQLPGPAMFREEGVDAEGEVASGISAWRHGLESRREEPGRATTIGTV
jgi:hypothetical protein